MAGEAHLRARLTLDSNVDEAVKLASQSLTKAATDVERAQKKMAETITKGDPLKAIEVQARKEIAAIERLAEKDVALRAQAEQAKEAIIRRHGQRVNAILQRQEAEATKTAGAIRERFGKLEQPLNDLRGVVSGLGIASNTAAGQVAALAADSLGAFSSGGAIALGVAAVTGGVYALATAWKEARDATLEARTAAVRSINDANEAIEAQIEAVRNEAQRRRLRASGVTDDQLRGQDLVGAAQLQVQDADASVRAVERQLAELDERIAQADRQAASVRDGTALAGAARLRTLASERSALVQHLESVKHEAREAQHNLEGAKLAASELLNAPTMTAGTTPTGAPARRASAPRGAAEFSPAQEAARIREELGMGANEKFGASITAAAEEDRLWREYQEGWSTRFREATVEATKPDEETINLTAEQGAAWATSFASGFASALKSGDAGQIFGAALTGLAGILGMVLGGPLGMVVGGAGGILGGLFERGGVPFGHHLPQGRNGLAVLPSVNYDARPAWLHKNEVVMPEAVVNDTFGGLPQAAAVAAGAPLPGAQGPASQMVVNVRALDAVDAVGGIRRAFAPAFSDVRETRQAARMFDSLAPTPPRYA